jgi:hypothetical protein
LADPPVAYARGSEKALPNRDRQGVGAFDSGYVLFEFCKYLGNVCPTLTHKNLRPSGAGAFACEPIFSKLLREPEPV